MVSATCGATAKAGGRAGWQPRSARANKLQSIEMRVDRQETASLRRSPWHLLRTQRHHGFPWCCQTTLTEPMSVGPWTLSWHRTYCPTRSSSSTMRRTIPVPPSSGSIRKSIPASTPSSTRKTAESLLRVPRQGSRPRAGHLCLFCGGRRLGRAGLFRPQPEAARPIPASRRWRAPTLILVDGHTGEFSGHRPIIEAQLPPRICRSRRRVAVCLQEPTIGSGPGARYFEPQAVLAAGGLDPDLRSFADGFLARKIALTSGFCYTPQVGLSRSLFSTGFSRALLLGPRPRSAGTGRK